MLSRKTCISSVYFSIFSSGSIFVQLQVTFAGLVCYHMQFPCPVGFCAGSLCSSGFLPEPRAVHIRMTCPGCNSHLHTKAPLHDGLTDGSTDLQMDGSMGGRTDGWTFVCAYLQELAEATQPSCIPEKNSWTDARFSKAVQIIPPGRGLRPRSARWA